MFKELIKLEFRVNNNLHDIIIKRWIRSVHVNIYAVPAPSLVTLSSDTHNPIRPIGSAVTLTITCIVHVDLSSVVN